MKCVVQIIVWHIHAYKLYVCLGTILLKTIMLHILFLTIMTNNKGEMVQYQINSDFFLNKQA